jgi:hypothetical protein
MLNLDLLGVLVKRSLLGQKWESKQKIMLCKI